MVYGDKGGCSHHFYGLFPVPRNQVQGRSFINSYFYFLIATTYFFTLIYSIIFKLVSHSVSAYIQIFGDIILITTLVSATDGAESPFVFLYLFSIIPASIMLYRTGALAAAAAVSIFYGAVVDVQYYNLLPFIASTTLPVKTLFYVLSLHIAAFLLLLIWAAVQLRH